jgi:hypothetical protein
MRAGADARSVSCARGQASLEYLALIALLAAVLAVAAGLVVATGLGDDLVKAMRRALCVATGGGCGTGGPCVVASRNQTDSGELDLGLFRLGGDEALLREERSDGTVALTLVHRDSGGVQVALGEAGRLRLGRNTLVFGTELRAALVAQLGSGATYVVRDRAAADELERRLQLSVLARRPHASIENPGGSLVMTRPMPALPAPDFTFRERGTGFTLDGSSSWLVVKGAVHVGADRVAGERVDPRTGRRTVYLRHGGDAAASVTVLGSGIEGGGAVRQVLAVTVDRDGRPLDLEVLGARQLGAGVRVPGLVRGPAVAAGVPVTRPRMVEVDEHLDLTDPESRAVATAFLEQTVGPGRHDGVAAAAVGLRRRLDAAGSAQARLYVLDDTGRGIGGRFVGWGGSAGTDVATARLVAAQVRMAGGAWGSDLGCVA